MCGIFGAFRRQGAFGKVELNSFQEACNVIKHRGPDASDSKSFVTGLADQANLFFGHTRLAILDLDAASNQPFERDGLHMIYNGEVFNFKELRDEMSGDFTFITSSDTEVILRAYQKYGTACFGKFNGMWALAIYDSHRQKLILARDRFSVKPLYLFRDSNTLYFASEIKQFKKLNQVKLSPNMKILHAFLNQSLLDHDPATFYAEVTRFPAMHLMEIDVHTGAEELKKYWDFSPPGSFDTISDPGAYFKDLLIDSLKLRLRSDVPVGTLLSGGLDSSAITALIHQFVNPNVISFSVVSDLKAYSEEKFVDILIKENGILNQKLRFDNDLAIDNIDKVLEIQDEPFGSLSVVAQYLLFQQIKKETDIKVLLSGQGADEILLGYDKFFYFHLQQLWAERQYGKLLHTAGSSLIKGTTLRHFDLREAKRYLPGQTNKGRPYFTAAFENEALGRSGNMRLRQINDIEKYSIPALTHYEDRNSMAASIEVRLPFLDYRLVDFLVNLPTDMKLQGGWSKFILRESLTELPEAIRWRKDKKGFVTPEEPWMKGALGAYILDYMESHHELEKLGILDQKKFSEAMIRFRKGDKWLSYGDLFRVFIAEKWLNSF